MSLRRRFLRYSLIAVGASFVFMLGRGSGSRTMVRIDSGSAAVLVSGQQIDPLTPADLALESRIGDFVAENEPIKRVLSRISLKASAPIDVHYPAMELSGIDGELRVSFRLKNPTLDEALRRALDEAGGGRVVLHAMVHGDRILVSTLEELQHSEYASMRVYDISDIIGEMSKYDGPPRSPVGGQITGTVFFPPTPSLIPRSQAVAALINLIEAFIAPETWQDNGGTMSLNAVCDLLFVTQTGPRQREIQCLLANIRMHFAMRRNGSASAAARLDATPDQLAPELKSRDDAVIRFYVFDDLVNELIRIGDLDRVVRNFTSQHGPDPQMSVRDAAMNKLVNVIQDTVEPESWSNNGGTRQINHIAGVLVIAQTRQNHEQISAIIRRIRREVAAGKPITTTQATP